MAHILVTGSTEGLGRAAAQSLLDAGHQVVMHARSPERAAALGALASRAAGVVLGDLSSGVETRAIADQVNAIRRMDAIIHNPAFTAREAAVPRRRAMQPSSRSTRSHPIS